MSTLDTLRAMHTTRGKCGCCWNQIRADHPNNSRTICSCEQHEPCDTAELLDQAIAERDQLRATLDRVRAEVQFLSARDQILIRAALDEEEQS